VLTCISEGITITAGVVEGEIGTMEEVVEVKELILLQKPQ
jgi:hypothetical protein